MASLRKKRRKEQVKKIKERVRSGKYDPTGSYKKGEKKPGITIRRQFLWTQAMPSPTRGLG